MRRGQRLGWALLGVLALALMVPAAVFAHPLGNFTINQYTRIEATTGGLRVVYVLEMAEIPALREIQERIDINRDDDISDPERERYLAAKLDELRADLRLTIDDVNQQWNVGAVELTFPEGQAGLDLLRLRAEFTPASAVKRLTGTSTIAFVNDHAVDRLGWNEVVVTHGPGVRVGDSDAPLTGLTDELRNYPEERLSSPLDRREARFTVRVAPGVPAAAGFDHAAFLGVGDRGESGRAGGPVAALLTGKELSTAGLLLSLFLAAAWGAAHALSPGHGKTVVAAYLVGSRGTPRHALFLGATVTVTHTAGVLALGLITLFASRYILPEQLYPWLSLLSGVLVAGMGIVLLRQRFAAGRAGGQAHHHHADHDHHHDHDHDHHHDGHSHSHGGHTHSHLPPSDASLSWRSLLALGVSGGLVPCPSALIVLLGAIALGQVGLGLALVGAFSLGLAAALTAIGLLFLVAGRFLERHVPRGGRASAIWRYAPVAGAVMVTLVGLGIVLRAATGDGLF